MASIGNLQKLIEWSKKNEEGMTAEMLGVLSVIESAVYFDQLECARYLVERYKDEILSCPTKLLLPLWSAAGRGHLECLQFLMKNEITPSGHALGTTLEHAARGGQLECVTYMIEKHGQRISNEYKKSALKIARDSREKHEIVDPDKRAKLAEYLEKAFPLILEEIINEETQEKLRLNKERTCRIL